jgi:CHAD domain-containing protein
MKEGIQRCSESAIEPYLEQMLHQRWASYRQRFKECRHKPSPESIHEFRVANRRLTSQFLLLNALYPDLGRRPLKVLKRQLDALGDLRDVQVERTTIKQLRPRFAGLKDLQHHLERRERRLLKSSACCVRRFKIKQVKKWVIGLRNRLQQDARRSDRHRRHFKAASRCVAEAFAAVLRCRRAIDLSDLRTIHRTRVAFKKFRYLVETLPPQATGWNDQDFRRLTVYQRKMGAIQDLAVLQSCVEEFAREREEDAVPLSPFLAYLRQRLKRSVETFLKSSDDLLGFWPPLRPPLKYLADCSHGRFSLRRGASLDINPGIS